MGIRVLGNRMIVALEGISEMNRLNDKMTSGGIILAALGGAGGIEGKLGLADRWARVLVVGPDCTEIRVGDRVMIQAQKWTEGFKHDGVWLWMTNEDVIVFLDELHRESGGKEQAVVDPKLEVQ